MAAAAAAVASLRWDDERRGAKFRGEPAFFSRTGSGGLNQAVLGLHADLKTVSHQRPALNEPVDALTSFGEMVGLGHIGTAGKLVADALALASAVTAGGAVEALPAILQDVGSTATAASTLLAMPGSAGGLGAPCRTRHGDRHRSPI